MLNDLITGRVLCVHTAVLCTRRDPAVQNPRAEPGLGKEREKKREKKEKKEKKTDLREIRAYPSQQYPAEILLV